MNKTKTVLVSFLLFLSLSVGSTTHLVQVADFQFSPATISNVVVGDSIKWVWISGIHTTTSTSVPMGATSWNAPITSSFMTFVYRVTAPGTYNYWCTPHSPSMAGSFTAIPNAVVPISGSVPATFSLGQNFPNPFNPVTNIRIDVPSNSNVNLTVYDLLGNEVEVLVNQNLTAGRYNIDWDASKYPSGIYFYTMKTANFSDTKRMILVK